MSIVHSRGKLPGIFPLLLLLVCWSERLPAQRMESLLFSFLNFPAVQFITRDEIDTYQLEVNSGIRYDDTYRKRVNDRLALTWNSTTEELAAFLPYTKGRLTSGIHARFSSYRGHFRNTKDRTAVALVDDAKGNSLHVGIALTDGSRVLGANLEGITHQHAAEVEFKAYPSATNLAMRMYFLDWLEPTFGRVWDINSTYRMLKPTIMAGVPLPDERRLDLLISHTRIRLRPRVHYTNSSNKTELTGNRMIDLMLEIDESVLALGVENERRGTLWKAVFFDSPLMLDTDNHSPPTPVNLDYYSLGNGHFHRRGFNLQLLKEAASIAIELGIGTSRYASRLKMNTPVLGYYAGILPISHAAKGKLEGTSFSQRFKAQVSPVIPGIRPALIAGYTHGYYDLFIDGEGHLEFNLVSVPIDHPYQFHLHLVELGASLTFRRGPVFGRYAFTQLLPFITRVDKSPMRFHEKVPGITPQSRGGGVHQLTFSYRWD
ncbi:MAG: hypothetical protein JSU61_04115 [Fidelibacterota bacterium]|nr:MAG: hypothetical protein JSU61_04115 [Candidatus Neomarinimicrobiota bacterium]